MVISELQASLIGLGVAAVVVIYAYNKWQENRHRRLAEQILNPNPIDVLLGEGQSAQDRDGDQLAPSLLEEEPVVRVRPAVVQAPVQAPTQTVAQVAEALAAADAPEPTLSLAGERTDLVLRLESREPLAASLLWPAQQEALPRLSKSVLWFGLNERKGDWELLNAHGAGRYRRLQVALQLVDRQGPVTEAEINLFLTGVNQLAEHFHARMLLPDLGKVAAVAQELDQFCATVDVQIGVNVLTRDGSSIGGTKLRGLAEASGFYLLGDGAFHYRDEQGRPVFSLGALDGQLLTPDNLRSLMLQGVTLSLDVPRVQDGATAFNRMNLVAQQLALAIGGVVVDDNRAPVDERAVGIIRGKIIEFQHAMAERDIPAGGPLALRLFS